jgi:hypothetical protein
MQSMSRRYRYNRITGEQFSQALSDLRMGDVLFARLSGATDRRVQRWMRGEEEIPPFVPVLCSLLMLPGAIDTASEVAQRMRSGEDRRLYDRMTGKQLSQALNSLGLTMRQFARLSGAAERRVDYWLRGKEDIPHHVPVLCSLLTLPGAMDLTKVVTDSIVIDEVEDEPT